MRLLQLSLDTERDAPLELHPLLTVVHGLDDRDRSRLIRSVTAIAKGQDPGLPGLIEAHGIVLDLTGDALAMLDTGADVDPVVRRVDLPGAVATARDDRRAPDGETAAEGPDPAEALLLTAPKGVHPELDRARKRHRDASDSLAVLRSATEQAARDLDAAGRQRRRAAEELDAALSRAAAPLGPEHRTGPAGQEVASLEAELDRIANGIAELQGLDTQPLAVLLDAIENPGPTEMVPSPRAQELADRIGALQLQVAGLEDRLEAEGRGPVSAMRRLDEARADVQAAERALERADLDPADEVALRKAHEVVLDSERKASGLRARAGQRKLAEALARQQEILDRVGYPTWSAYIMGASLMGADPAAEERLAQARVELSAAEAHWARVSAAMEADPEHHALLDELERVEVEAIGLLLEREASVPSEREELEGCLRDLREPKHDVTPEQLVEALAFHLESIGYPLGEARRDMAHVCRVAQAFLAEAEGIAARVEELAAERLMVESRLADACSRAEAEAWAALEASVELPSGAGPSLADLEHELARARAAEEEKVELLEGREALLEAALATEQAAARRAVAVARQVLEATGADRTGHGAAVTAGGVDHATPGWSEVDPEAIELYLLARLAAQRQVSYAGSVPLLIDDALLGIPDADVRRVLDGLGRMAESVQVVYLSEDPAVLEWAQRQHDRAAAVGSPSAHAGATLQG
jgi:hypothetical protein